MAKIAVIRIRGLEGVKHEINDTLDMLGLYRNHFCVVLEDTPSNMGMIRKCKDYATYGEIDDETYKMLVDKRGIKDKEGKLKKFFRLQPPRKGFERKGIKTPYSLKGALGYRGKKINDLIKRML
jgi:large subunit ribosomal protein L30